MLTPIFDALGQFDDQRLAIGDRTLGEVLLDDLHEIRLILLDEEVALLGVGRCLMSASPSAFSRFAIFPDSWSP